MTGSCPDRQRMEVEAMSLQSGVRHFLDDVDPLIWARGEGYYRSGQAEAQALIAGLRRAYPRRLALLDELGKSERAIPKQTGTAWYR